MNTATAYTATVLATRHPLLQRWGWRLLAAWQAWREQARGNAELRALEALSDATLRDIGMAERVLQQPGVSLIDYERGRW